MAFEVKEKSPKLSPEMQDVIERSHRDGIGDGYDDTERYKYLIMKMFTDNQDILWTLHNESLEKDVDINGNLYGASYRNVNIFNYLKIPGVQSEVSNFICFEVNDVSKYNGNAVLLEKNIIFRTISHEDECITDWGISRQDLLAAIIKNEFDWTNVFGMHIEKVSDVGRISENGYYYREFIYETVTPNNLVNKAKNGGVTYGKHR